MAGSISAAGSSSAPRIRYGDIKPYERPDSLADLVGPTSGHVELPIGILWVSNDGFDLDNADDLRLVYRAVIAEGTSAEQCRYLNAAVLHEVWDELLLPRRARAEWEAQFPTLAGLS